MRRLFHVDHRGKTDTFSIGWDVPQKNDGLTAKVGSSGTRMNAPKDLTGKVGSYIPQHTTITNPKYAEPNILTHNG